MNIFDSSILSLLNQFARHWYVLDSAMVFVAAQDLPKGGVIVAALWGIWFNHHRDQRRNQSILISSVAAGAIAILAARLAVLVLPFRVRPLYDPDLHFQHPFNVESIQLENWSSFPSDHATLFFALAVGIFLCCKRMGVLTLLYVFFVISFPRVYLGFHYPTDVIVGALMGSTLAYLFATPRVRTIIEWLPMQWIDTYPRSFYACFFLVSWQMAQLFGSPLFHTLRTFLHFAPSR
jgi:undecaprenyl-diphosphatase